MPTSFQFCAYLLLADLTKVKRIFQSVRILEFSSLLHREEEEIKISTQVTDNMTKENVFYLHLFCLVGIGLAAGDEGTGTGTGKIKNE